MTNNANTRPAWMKLQDWTISLRTGKYTSSTITLEAYTSDDAIAHARRLLGNFPATVVS